MLPGAIRVLNAWLLLVLAPQLSPDAEQFWTAARQGDVAAVRALLAKGVDINSRFRYGTTALWHAAERGHVEVVKLLLASGADVNAKDDLAGPPIVMAAFKGNTEIIKLLLEKNSTGLDVALAAAAGTGQTEVVRLLLANGGWSAETLASALDGATKANRAEIAELLRKAGAKPIAKTEVRIDPETLATYSGQYQSRDGMEFSFTVQDGKLTGGNIFEDPAAWEAVDKTTFRGPSAFPMAPPATIAFQVEGGKVTGCALKRGGPDVVFRKVGAP